MASELEPRLDSGRKSESPMVSASDSGLEPESLAWASESVPGLEPEMLTGSDSVMPMASQALESAWVPGLASGSVPGLEPESALASGRDRTRHRRQIPSALSWR